MENLRPGRYYITAGLVDRPTYYPGVTALSGATAVDVLSETPLTGINFSMVLPTGVKVSGRAMTPSGPLQSGRVALLFGPPAVEWRDVAVGPDGTFEFQRVAPGTYQLTSPNGRLQPPVAVVQVADKDIEGLQLVIIPNVAVPVRAVIDGNSPIPRFFLMFSPFKGGPSIQGEVNFSIALEEGDYRVSWSKVPPGFEVKSITAGDVDLLTSRLKVSVSSPAPQIQVTLHVEGNPWVKFAGKVTGTIPGPTLTLNGLLNSAVVELPIKADGSFEIASILAGPYTARPTLNASPPALGSNPPIQFDVPNTDTTGFVIALPVLKEVPGVITNSAGLGIQGRIQLNYSEIRANGAAGGSRSITSQPDGKFTILMSEGERRITLTAPGYTIKSVMYGATDLMKENMRVANTDTAELRIVLETPGR